MKNRKLFAIVSLATISFTMMVGCDTNTSQSESLITSGEIMVDNNQYFIENEEVKFVSLAENYADSKFSIPSYINNFPVTSIAIDAFDKPNSIVELTIPGTIKTIEKLLLKSSSNLTTIYLNRGVEEIKEEAFSDSSTLNMVLIPNSVSKIGINAFSSCEDLKVLYEGYKMPDGWVEGWNNLATNSRHFTIYWYSHEKPRQGGYYWHYVDNVPTIWPYPYY